MLSKGGHSVRDCRKIGCELFKGGSFCGSKSKKGSVGESELKKGVNVATHPRQPFWRVPTPASFCALEIIQNNIKQNAILNNSQLLGKK